MSQPVSVSTETPAENVALVVNAFERNLPTVLAPGFFSELEHQNGGSFAERVLLVNNVEDPERVAEVAGRRLADGEVSAVHFVTEEIEAALTNLGLSRGDLGPHPYSHFSDYLYVAPFAVSSPYLLYWDGDVRLSHPVDWVSEATTLLGADSQVFSVSARPCWWDPRKELTVEMGERFALGYGFSDQMFLARTRELRMPIYRYSAPASTCHPASHLCETFEQRVNSFMRRRRRFRAIHLHSRYEHEGRGWYWPTNVGNGARFVRDRFVSRALKLQPFRFDPAWKV